MHEEIGIAVWPVLRIPGHERRKKHSRHAVDRQPRENQGERIFQFSYGLVLAHQDRQAHDPSDLEHALEHFRVPGSDPACRQPENGNGGAERT